MLIMISGEVTFTTAFGTVFCRTAGAEILGTFIDTWVWMQNSKLLLRSSDLITHLGDLGAQIFDGLFSNAEDYDKRWEVFSIPAFYESMEF